MQQVTTNAENFKQERAKLEEDTLNVELERRMLEEKLEELKGNGEALITKEWEGEKQQLKDELEEERGRIKKLAEELAWERERKDAFDKRLEGIENRGESERNRTLESEKRQMELKIKDLEGTITDNENKMKEPEGELFAKQQAEEERHKSADAMARDKAKLEELLTEQANKFKEDIEKLDNDLAAQTKTIAGI
jgi:colicin import membrane protein